MMDGMFLIRVALYRSVDRCATSPNRYVVPRAVAADVCARSGLDSRLRKVREGSL